jgi:site-specific recombinase XerD
MSTLAPLLQGFFTDRLGQRGVSPNTVAAYRDTWRLLLGFVHSQRGIRPSTLDINDLDCATIGAFLDHLEKVRGNAIRTRNLRLVAIHSFFSYAALRCPEHAAVIQQVLAIPTKRADTTMVTFLTRTEVDALLAGPDRDTALGRRDHLLLALAIQTGLRVSELTSLVWSNISLGTGAHVRCNGKGRKQRCTPLTKAVATLAADWATETQSAPADPVFLSRLGGPLSRNAVTDLLAKYVADATRRCPSLTTKHITPHTLRHTAAMDLLQAGVDTSVIALWLGHASTRSTQPYLHADLTIKEQALARTAPHPAARHRYQPSDPLLAFLESL